MSLCVVDVCGAAKRPITFVEDVDAAEQKNKQIKKETTAVTREEAQRAYIAWFFGGLPYLADAHCGGFGSNMNWLGWSMCPTNDEEMALFVISLFNCHVRKHYGSHELQMIAHTIRAARGEGFTPSNDCEERKQRFTALILRIEEEMETDSVLKRYPERRAWLSFMLRQTSALLFRESLVRDAAKGISTSQYRLPYWSFYSESKRELDALKQLWTEMYPTVDKYTPS